MKGKQEALMGRVHMKYLITFLILVGVVVCFDGSTDVMRGPGQHAAPNLHSQFGQPAAPAPVPPRVQTARRRGTSEMRAFRDESGTTVMTNRPQRYENDSRFEDITLERVSVPRQFRSLSRSQITDHSKIGEIVEYYCRMYNLDQSLVYAVIRAESNFNPNAVSRAGAKGLMQLMPGTASDMGVSNIFDPAENIAGGTQYLSKMLKLFNGNLTLALAGYNAGPEAVRRHNGVPPFNETQNYIRTVRHWERHFRRNGVQSGLLAQIDDAIPPVAAQKEEPVRYVVHFHSGLAQPADAVIDDDPYYYIQIQGRTRRIHKDRVREVTEDA